MNLNDFKAYLENKLDEAKANLMFQDAMQPVFAYVIDGRIEELNLYLPDQESDPEGYKKEISSIRSICKSPSVEYAAIVCDAWVKSAPLKELEAIETEGKDLQDVEGSIECLMVYLYTRDGAIQVRELPYKKRKERDYWFSDKGWGTSEMEKPPVISRFVSRLIGKPLEPRRFANPFIV
jgi:hypothetical protein